MTVSLSKKTFFAFIPTLLLSAALTALAWIGADFSPGFSEGLAAVFVAAGAVMLAGPRTVWGRILFLAGTFCVPVGTYVYAAGEDHLSACVWISLLSALVLYAVLLIIRRGKKEPVSEHLLRFALLASGLFSLLCGVFSTALLPVGAGLLLCFAARFTEKALPYLTAAGLLLVDAFLLAPMCFGGVL